MGIILNELSTFEKYILRLVGEDQNYKPIGGERRTANYLASLGVFNYAGSGRYCLTDHGKILFDERMLHFENKQAPQEVSENEQLLKIN